MIFPWSIQSGIRNLCHAKTFTVAFDQAKSFAKYNPEVELVQNSTGLIYFKRNHDKIFIRKNGTLIEKAITDGFFK